MAPPTTSRRSKEDFVQWKEPSQVVCTNKPGFGRASPIGARKKKQATRQKVIVDASADSRTASESNSVPPGAADSESHREIEAAPPTSSHGAPPPATRVAVNKFVPPRPVSASESRETPQGASMYLQDQGRDVSMSPQGRVLHRVQRQSRDIVPDKASDNPEENAVHGSQGRPPGTVYVLL